MKFTDKIHSARFTNETYDTIEIVYDEDGILVPMYIEVDFEHPDFIDLEKAGWDLERIQEFTKSYNKEQSQAYKNIIKWHAADEVAKVKDKFAARQKDMIEAEIPTSELLKVILESNDNEEVIFKTKLAIFEIDEIKNSKDRNLKMSIRKCKSMLELISQLNGIYKSKD